ncbi:hypothetical protein [Dokdonia donghaensis]
MNLEQVMLFRNEKEALPETTVVWFEKATLLLRRAFIAHPLQYVRTHWYALY